VGGAVPVGAVVAAAETEKVTVVRAEPEDVVVAGNYQESLFAAAPKQDPLLENQSVGAAEREDAVRGSWAAEGDHPEEN